MCTVSLRESSKDILQNMKKWVDMQTDKFLFNIVKGVYNNDVNYKILEDIKDGKALATKYNSQNLYFKTPNVLIVFLVASQKSWTQLRKCNSSILCAYHSLTQDATPGAAPQAA